MSEPFTLVPLPDTPPRAQYFRSDVLSLPDGKQWVQIDPQAVGIETPGAGSPSDPTSELELLGGLKGDPNVVGHEELDGVSVTHYSVTLDFAAVLDEVAEGSKALGSDALVKGLQLLENSVDLSHVPAEVWLDEGGLVRQFKFSLHLPVNGSTIDEVATMKFFDFGTPVAVEAPPDDQVVPFTEVPDVFRNLTAS